MSKDKNDKQPEPKGKPDKLEAPDDLTQEEAQKLAKNVIFKPDPEGNGDSRG